MENHNTENNKRKEPSLFFLMFLTMLIFVLIIVIFKFLLLPTTDNTLNEVEMMDEKANEIYEEMASKQLLACYSSLEYIDNKDNLSEFDVPNQYSLEFRLKLNQDFSQDCFNEFSSFQSKLDSSRVFRFKNYIVTVEQPNGEIFTYENYRTVNIDNKDEYLKYQVFGK